MIIAKPGWVSEHHCQDDTYTYPAFTVMSEAFMLCCTHVLLSVIDRNICNTAQVTKITDCFSFFLQSSYRGAMERRYCIFINNKEQERSDCNTCSCSIILQDIQSTLPIPNQFVFLSPPSPTHNTPSSSHGY